MRDRVSAQTFGSLIVFGTAAAAEIAARFLEAHPGAPLAWYLAFDCFHLFRLARSEASPLRFLHTAYLLHAELLCLLLIGLAHLRRHRFGLGLFANLSLLVSAFLAQAWLEDASRRIALAHPAVNEHPYDASLVVILLSSALLAATTSHVTFIRAGLRARQEAPVLRMAEGGLQVTG